MHYSNVNAKWRVTNLAKNVSARMPERVATFVWVKFMNLQLTVALQGPRHVPQHTVYLYPNNRHETENNLSPKKWNQKPTQLAQKYLPLPNSNSLRQNALYLGNKSALRKPLVNLLRNIHRRGEPLPAIPNSAIRHRNPTIDGTQQALALITWRTKKTPSSPNPSPNPGKQ